MSIVPHYIMSKDNPQIKRVRALLQSARQRREEGAFVVEGVRLVEEALAAGQVAALFVAPEMLAAHARSRAFLDSIPADGDFALAHVDPSIFASLADTATPQGVVAVCAMPAEAELPPTATLAVLLDGVQDPGNAGMIVRAAAAANADGVIFGPGSVDPYNPKVLRGAMGAHFRTALLSLRSEEAVHACVQGFPQRVVAAAREGVRYDAVDWTVPTLLIAGAEAHGAGKLGSSLQTVAASIPLARGVESLNVAMAAGVLLFEAVRQRSDDA
jgi:TrmH family RNA methyltransferase